MGMTRAGEKRNKFLPAPRKFGVPDWLRDAA